MTDRLTSKPDMTKPAERKQQTRKPIERIVRVGVMCLTVILLGIIVFAYLLDGGVKAQPCGDPVTQVTVSTPDSRAVANEQVIDGDAGVIIDGTVAQLADGCSVLLLDYSGNRYYPTYQFSPLSSFRFIDKPIGGESDGTRVELLVILATKPCYDEVIAKTAAFDQLPAGCSLATSLTVNANRA